MQKQSSTNLQSTAKSIETYSKFIDDVKNSFLERDEEVDILATSLISEQSVVFVGPPGTGKSQLVRAFALGLGTSYFDYLITPYTTPDEIIGPISLKSLKEKDIIVRNLKGKIADAKVVFLDEIFKGNSGTSNSILGIINEKIIDAGDGKKIKVPLELLIGASNEYPTDSGRSAFWDRWVFRRKVIDIKEDASFERMWLRPQSIGKVKSKISFSDIQNIRTIAAQVDTKPVIEKIMELRNYAKEKNIQITLRRWNHARKALQARAAIDGRNKCNESDIEILKDVLWEKPKQKADMEQKIIEICHSYMQEALELKDAAEELYRIGTSEKLPNGSEATFKDIAAANKRLKKIVKNLSDMHNQHSDKKLLKMIHTVNSYQKEIAGKIADVL